MPDPSFTWRESLHAYDLDEHGHGELGPAALSLAIAYSAPGVPTSVTRNDAGLISTSVITYAGSHVASVVTSRYGKTITVTPTYTANDITAVSRVVT